MSAAKSTRPVAQAAIPAQHLHVVAGTELAFEVISLEQAMNVHEACVFVACRYVKTEGVVAAVDLYLSHTTHLARTLADPQLQTCLGNHGATHVRIWREALATRRRALTESMPECRGACNRELLRASR